jgi:energy-coupling factor transporter ATP-binding protein EcfA2
MADSLYFKVNDSDGYGSFSKGFDFEFNGKLIIISGLNGTGKTQLLEILKGSGKLRSKIDSEVKVGGNTIKKEEIIYKHFQDFLSLNSFGNFTRLSDRTPEIFRLYRQFQESNFGNIPQDALLFSNSLNELKSKFDSQKFSDTELNIFKTKLNTLENFEWKQNDIFSNDIFSLFKNYAQFSVNQRDKLLKSLLEDGDSAQVQENIKKLENESPWTKINDILSSISVKYKMPDEFKISDQGELDPEPVLIYKNNHSKTRQLSHLSDGEKTLISVALSNAQKNSSLRLLLLDEVDATLNPSMLHSFKDILKKLTDSGVMVVLVTHSSDTLFIFDKDKNASFYEIYEQEYFPDKFLKLDFPREYDEIGLLKINGFYDQGDLDFLKKVGEDISGGNNILFVEGITDKKIIENAYKVLKPNTNFKIIAINGAGKSIRASNYCVKYLKLHSSNSKILFLLDYDFEGVSAVKKVLENISGVNNVSAIKYSVPVSKQYLISSTSKYCYLNIEDLLPETKISHLINKVAVLGKEIITVENKNKIIISDLTSNFKEEDFNEMGPTLNEIDDFFKKP